MLRTPRAMALKDDNDNDNDDNCNPMGAPQP